MGFQVNLLSNKVFEHHENSKNIPSQDIQCKFEKDENIPNLVLRFFVQIWQELPELNFTMLLNIKFFIKTLLI